MKNIAVIGSGTMGNGIAHTFAQQGYNVALIDISQPALDKALATISKNLDRIVAKGAITEADKIQTLKNITTYTVMAEGVQNADLVVEAATENVENIDLLMDLTSDKSQLMDNIRNTLLSDTTTDISNRKSLFVSTRVFERVLWQLRQMLSSKLQSI